MPLSKSPTQIVVGGLIGLGLVVLAYSLTGPLFGTLLTVLLAYEGWTLINKYPNDTISEVIWKFSRLPMVPFVFGVAMGWGVQSGVLANPWLLGALAFLCGHFFFQSTRKEEVS